MIKANLYSIDIDILKNAITTYQQQHDEDPNYIIMNTNTERMIRTDCNIPSNEFAVIKYDKSIIKSYYDSDIKFTTFWGIPIAFCNRLEDGEIELI